MSIKEVENKNLGHMKPDSTFGHNIDSNNKIWHYLILLIYTIN